MSEDIDDLPKQDELAVLKSRADLIGLSYHPSIGAEKLKQKIEEHLSETAKDEPVEEVKKEETESQRRARKRAEATKLVRIRVTCMNPAKNEWEGEIFTAGNSLVGTFKKFVPFNAEEGWHVPYMIYKQIVNRQCQIFTSVRDSRGNTSRRSKLIKEFAVEVLDPLTKEELAELARRQAMAKSID